MGLSLALISDLHANLLALDAVLADVRERAIERVVCLGDVATLGPKPNEVVRRLRALGCDCIMGNHDAFMLDADLIHTYTEAPVVVDAVEWCRERLDEDNLAFLTTFRSSMELQLGHVRVCLYHGSPRSHMQDLLVDSPASALDEALLGFEADVYAGGHTHLQMLRQHRGKLIVNPGSVGMPFREAVRGKAPEVLPHAEYASILAHDGRLRVELHRLQLDRSQLYRQAKEAADNPITPDLLANYA